ncbi:MAG: hypothetical protein IT454_08655 [Planctomycetes bacterium]|nr:hypothetical protein [Planctomycetota bacterium]
MRTLVRWAAVAALVSMLGFESARAQSQRFAYVLAGQSNIERLASVTSIGCGSFGNHQTNVTYSAAVATPASPGWPAGRFTRIVIPASTVAAWSPGAYLLGNILGAHHGIQPVEVCMIARSGSSLLFRNRPAGFEAWVDERAPSNPLALVRRMEPALAQLGLGAQDELHIVWGQGESDALSAQPTAVDEYSAWAHMTFAWLALAAGKPAYAVHVVTVGAMNSTLVPDAHANAIRDALRTLPNSAFALPGLQPSISVAAHHYDLSHADPVHLDACGSFALAGRIAQGILTPSALPRVISTAPTVLNASEMTFTTNVPLVPIASSQSSNSLFEIFVDGLEIQPNDFKLDVTGTTILLRVSSADLSTATEISVRYVPGSGLGRNWDVTPPIQSAALQLPLEPFALP